MPVGFLIDDLFINLRARVDAFCESTGVGVQLRGRAKQARGIYNCNAYSIAVVDAPYFELSIVEMSVAIKNLELHLVRASRMRDLSREYAHRHRPARVRRAARWSRPVR